MTRKMKIELNLSNILKATSIIAFLYFSLMCANENSRPVDDVCISMSENPDMCVDIAAAPQFSNCHAAAALVPGLILLFVICHKWK